MRRLLFPAGVFLLVPLYLAWAFVVAVVFVLPMIAVMLSELWFTDDVELTDRVFDAFFSAITFGGRLG